MFTGIARLAREGQTLEEKRRVEYHTLPTRRLLNRCSSSRMPFTLTVNPYRGCEFGCRYCYARYTHEFMEYRDPEQFERLIFAKDFTAEGVWTELRHLPVHEWVALGTATDPYQPAERRFRRTRLFLEVFSRERGRRLGITTKGDLITRDVDLLQEIARHNTLAVTVTITTMDTRLARSLETYAPRPDLRAGAVKALAAAGLSVGVFASPVLPGLNDSKRSLDAVARAAWAAGAQRFGAQPLFLKPSAARVFLPWISKEFPPLARAYQEHFSRNAYLRGPWVDRLRETVAELREKYGLAGRGAFQPGAPVQIALFEDPSPQADPNGGN